MSWTRSPFLKTYDEERDEYTQASLTGQEGTKLSIPIMISLQECSQDNRFNCNFFKPEDLPVVPWSSEDSSKQPPLSYNSQSRVYPAAAIQENRAFIRNWQILTEIHWLNACEALLSNARNAWLFSSSDRTEEKTGPAHANDLSLYYCK